MGRNEKELGRLKQHVLTSSPHAKIETVTVTGDIMADAAARWARQPDGLEREPRGPLGGGDEHRAEGGADL